MNSNKERTSFTLDKDLMKEFREYAKKDCLNMSAYVEAKITQYVKERRAHYGKLEKFATSD